MDYGTALVVRDLFSKHSCFHWKLWSLRNLEHDTVQVSKLTWTWRISRKTLLSIISWFHPVTNPLQMTLKIFEQHLKLCCFSRWLWMCITVKCICSDCCLYCVCSMETIQYSNSNYRWILQIFVAFLYFALSVYIGSSELLLSFVICN